MAAFSFDARKHDPRKRENTSPRNFALELWLQYENEDADMDPATAFDLARYDFDIYEALRVWAWDQDIDSLSIEWQAALGRVFGRKPPRKGKGATSRRNARYRAIANALKRGYGIPLVHADHGGSIRCAAGILATFPNSPSEGQIANILTTQGN